MTKNRKNRTVPIFRFKRIDSTNSAALRYARRGARSGSVFVADYQTKGRGKWGRKWVSPPGKNLLFSILLRPKLKAPEAPMVTQIACRSVARVLELRFGLPTSFKRPNDVLVNGRKICGVLVEAQGRSNGELESLVIGIGLNVNASPQELAPGATSLKAEIGRRQPRGMILVAMLRQLKKDLKGWHQKRES